MGERVKTQGSSGGVVTSNPSPVITCRIKSTGLINVKHLPGSQGAPRTGDRTLGSSETRAGKDRWRQVTHATPAYHRLTWNKKMKRVSKENMNTYDYKSIVRNLIINK